jgi:nitrogen-specific signal transduction histidine kinase
MDIFQRTGAVANRILSDNEAFGNAHNHLRAMTRECFEVTSILVHTRIDRARLFTSSDLQNEKMISLSKLSRVLAHELNNPVTRDLTEATLSDAQIARKTTE